MGPAVARRQPSGLWQRVSSEWQHLIRWCLALKAIQIGHPSKKSRTSRGCKISLCQEAAEISLHRLSPVCEPLLQQVLPSYQMLQEGKCLVSSFQYQWHLFSNSTVLDTETQHLQLIPDPQAPVCFPKGRRRFLTLGLGLHFSHRSSPSH